MSSDDGARARLLSTAAQLFATKGLDGVSLRTITREAGVKHATAIQYHFGDRSGLLDAILVTHFDAVEQRRARMLDHLDLVGVTHARQLGAALVEPLAAELRDERGRLFLQIYGQMVMPPVRRFEDDGTSMWRWRDAVARFLATGADRLYPRYSALTFTTNALAARASDADTDVDQLFVSRLVDVVTAIISAPESEETREVLERQTGA